MNPTHLDAFQQLIATPTVPDLGPGPRPGVQPLKELEAQLDAFLENQDLPQERMLALRSAVLLWHDHLDESHSISQNLSNATGSFLHGIMHRREPDYSNAKYWFRRVGHHPALSELSNQAADLLSGRPGSDRIAPRLLPKGGWDPFVFVDFCEACAWLSRDADQYQLAQQLQALEFRVLLARL